MALFQKVGQTWLDRKEHVWYRKAGKSYKCVLCGAVTAHPPSYPTDPAWMPERYEKLKDEERKLCPRD